MESGTHKLPNDVQTTKSFNFLEGYFGILEKMIEVLQDDLQNAKQIDLVTPGSQLYKLHFLKTKLKSCLTPDLACDTKTSMPTGISNKYRRIFFIKIVSHISRQGSPQIIYE
jgi:hypothetical protein